MRTWFGLLGAPILALVDQSVSYATVGWSCAHQYMFALHVIHAVFLAAIVIGTLCAWHRWRQTRLARTPGEEPARRHFLAGLAAASGALSTLVVGSMWLPVWVLGPCLS
jgi:uncharacterized iron-regulated membrane protein